MILIRNSMLPAFQTVLTKYNYIQTDSEIDVKSVCENVVQIVLIASATEIGKVYTR